MKSVLRFFRREAVFTISLVAALLSFLLAAPGRHTLAGIDTTTLLMLFTLMTVVAGLRRCGVFDLMGRVVARRIRTRRGLAAALTAVCFFLAMIATNDVALITLVPFTLLLMAGGRERDVIVTVVLETLAANLGSMVTPIGNPQNLYGFPTADLALRPHEPDPADGGGKAGVRRTADGSERGGRVHPRPLGAVRGTGRGCAAGGGEGAARVGGGGDRAGGYSSAGSGCAAAG